ncbi:MAG: pantoate--beta-alanine ligase [Algicola sp.]|nr:pantoate--beta-alanine ligase [Algicola sp.]
MKTVSTVSELKIQVRAWHQAGQSVAFVPTMGNLHDGHSSLVQEASKRADKVVVSIFINPMQFDNQEDLAIYPRTMEDDSNVLKAMNTDLLFLPTPDIMYPKGLDNTTFVEVPMLSGLFCGNSRPGHFRGVTTVVNKLLNLVEPDVAIFGEKDFQQLLLIRHMVADLFMNVEIVGAPTLREPSGLAMSSRNNYLSTEDREDKAPIIYQVLSETKAQIKAGDRDFANLELAAAKRIDEAGLNTDFFSIQNAANLSDAQSDDTDLVILVAAFLGKARLIDNLFFEV